MDGHTAAASSGGKKEGERDMQTRPGETMTGGEAIVEGQGEEGGGGSSDDGMNEG
jgi:hypothetical protein